MPLDFDPALWLKGGSWDSEGADEFLVGEVAESCTWAPIVSRFAAWERLDSRHAAWGDTQKLRNWSDL